MTTRERLHGMYHKMTPRELDIASAIAKGNGNRAIAGDLGVTEQSVKNLITRIMQKMNVTNRVQVALVARGVDLDSD